MHYSECHEAVNNFETLSLVESTSEDAEYSEEDLKLLSEKWSWYGTIFHIFTLLLVISLPISYNIDISCMYSAHNFAVF